MPIPAGICAALGNGAQAAHGANWGQRLLNSECSRAAQAVGKGNLWAGQTGHTGFQTLSYLSRAPRLQELHAFR